MTPSFELPGDPSSPAAADVIHVLFRTTHYIQREMEARLAALDMPLKITGPRLRVLIKVAKNNRMRMNELASQLGIKARTVTDFVDALEQEGLLVRVPDPQDRRATLLELTEAAQKHMATVQAIQADIAESLLESLSDEQRSELLRLLSLMSQQLPCPLEP